MARSTKPKKRASPGTSTRKVKGAPVLAVRLSQEAYDHIRAQGNARAYIEGLVRSAAGLPPK